MERTEPSIDRRLQEVCSIFIWRSFRGQSILHSKLLARRQFPNQKSSELCRSIYTMHMCLRPASTRRSNGGAGIWAPRSILTIDWPARVLAVGTGRLNIYDQAPRDRGRGAVHHLGVKVANLRDVWPRLQAQGITSPHGLREQDGWRYVMISAPDGILVELFEFDDPSAPANADPGAGF